MVSSLTLNQGIEIPQIGFGVFLLDPATTQQTVEKALEAGYRHIDTATGYHNEKEVGAAIRASGIKRSELFVTTKLRNDHHKQGDICGAFERSLSMLDIDYIDLYLIHWPMPLVGRYVGVWREFEQFQKDGNVRAIGVSNFHIEHLQRLLDETDVIPAVNQVECHPLFQQRELIEFMNRYDIKLEAWAPLGQGRFPLDSLEPINTIAIERGKTPAQIILRWHIQEQHIPLPKTSTPSRMVENIDIFDFELNDTEMQSIRSLDTNHRLAADPMDVNDE